MLRGIAVPGCIEALVEVIIGWAKRFLLVIRAIVVPFAIMAYANGWLDSAESSL
jgi:hypothetical protein